MDKYFETNFNGAKAARLAGFSEKGAKVQAFRLLTKANLIAEIGAGKKEHCEKAGVTREEWFKKFAACLTGMSTGSTTMKVKASELMAMDKIRIRIKELSEPIVLKVRKTREDLIELFEAIA